MKLFFLMNTTNFKTCVFFNFILALRSAWNLYYDATSNKVLDSSLKLTRVTVLPSPIRTMFLNESSRMAQLPENLSPAADADEVVAVDVDADSVVVAV